MSDGLTRQDVGDGDLDLLNCFPEGTRGFLADRLLLEQLRSLCRTHGYGAVAQMAGWLEELARDPAGAAPRFRRARAQRVAQFNEETSRWKHKKAAR